MPVACALAFSPDGQTLATAGDDLGIRLWDVATGASSHRLFPVIPAGVLTGFHPRREDAVFRRGGRTIRRWDPKSTTCRAVWKADEQVYSLAISPDGQTLAAAQHGGTVAFWDVDHEKARSVLHGHTADVLSVAFSADGLTLASTGRDKTVRIWEPATGQPLLTLQGHEAAVHAAAFSPDGTLLATGSHDGKIKLWRAPREDRPKQVASSP